MTKETGLASSQTLIVGAAVAVLAALAAAYGLGVFEKSSQTEPVQAVMSQPAPAAAPKADAEPTPEVKQELVTESETAPAETSSKPTEPETEIAAVAKPENVSEDATAGKPVAEPVVQPLTGTQAEATLDDTSHPAAGLPTPPSFDVVRVESDGTALVAGIALDGDQVEVLVDRVAIAKVEPGSDGKFVAFLTLPPSDKPRMMTLLMRAGDAQIPSEDQVIIAPVKAVVSDSPADETNTVVAADTAQAEETGITAEAGKETVEPQVAASEPAGAQSSAPESVQNETVETGQKVGETETGIAASSMQPDTAEPGRSESQDTKLAMADPAPAEVQSAPTPTSAPSAAPAVLIAGKDGVSVVQPAQPGTNLTDLVLDAISYSDTGAVDLTGRGAASMGVRAYLNNTAQASAEIGSDSAWKIRLSDVAPGVYTLRIDQVDASGKVTSRVETPFKREAEEKIAAASANAARQQANTADPEAARTAPPIRVITVQPGHTLWAIAKDNYGEGTLYVRLFEANRNLIRDPDLIYPGQVFDIPRD
ncbi:LysM peptidoglycan-binding domain-containing protein [Thalassovita sp.]|uniref:LysM peptidoglycan-binding domain-containing protein n=1 Tax=Thalassovita sp. TaxID=1979401 RepID=UPI002B27B3AD|nr:LysM peptidoglycan-binding domain-containing protein [Thalassovita sp.]